MSWRGLLIAAGLLAMPVTGHAASRSYIVTDFDSLRLEAPIEVAVETGRGISARGEGSSDLLERIDLRVSARVLTVRIKPSLYESRKGNETGGVRLVLTVPSLRSAQITGAGSLRARGLDKGRAELISAGSGSLAVTGIDSDTLTITQIGSGSVALAGKAKSVTMRISGAGVVDAAAFSAADLDLRLEGAANVAVKADRAAKIVAAGAGSATITGKAACTVSHAGSGAVNCGGKSF